MPMQKNRFKYRETLELELQCHFPYCLHESGNIFNLVYLDNNGHLKYLSTPLFIIFS